MNQKLTNETKKTLVAENLIFARSLFARMKGLLGRKGLANSEAMWINPCNNIHTFFMKFSIDAVFVDRQLRVKKVKHDLKPGHIVWPVWGAHSVFEMSSGRARLSKIEEGDILNVGN